MSTSNSQSTASTFSILGGDYAGLSATFSSKGELVPVPEHLVPESMVEWGEIPSSLETLTSEDLIDNDDTDSANMERITISVLPEVGCGLDNLEVTKKSEVYAHDESILKSWKQGDQDQEVIAVDRVGQTLDLETIFQIDSVKDEDGNTFPRRIRLSISLNTNKVSEEPTLSKLIALHIERQASPQSSKGISWTGTSYNSGGLDARTVMNTIGKDIVYGDVFSVKRKKGGEDIWDIASANDGKDGARNALEGEWESTMNGDDAEVVSRTKEYFGGDDSSVNTIRLPQNILVRYGHGMSADPTGCAIEVSHFGTIRSDDKTYLQRRVVLRSLGLPGAEESSSFNGSNLGDVSYWTEEKELQV